MKSIFLYSGILIIVVSVFLVVNKWPVYTVETKGALVKTQIRALPKDCAQPADKLYAGFEYQAIVYNKRISTGFCTQHAVGDFVDMKFLDGEKTILFPEETNKGSMIGIGVFLVLGIFSLLFGARKEKRV